MEYKCFEYSLEDHIAHVTLSRGDELNTMIKEFWSELPNLIDEISNEGKARVILISAQGKHFTAGMDLGNFTDSDLAGKDEHQGLQNEAIYRLTKDLQYSFSSLEKSRIPVIVTIQGACVGGGVDMICACDIRYATSDAFFCIQETNLGLVADVGTLQRLPKLIPEGIVRDLALTGRKMKAYEAEKYGLISAIFDDQESMLDHAMDTARAIASKSPLAISGIKEIINYSRDHSVDESLNYVALWNAAMKYEDDLKETFLAKMEK
ncbi:MAG: crotonase/enoyl-CoA hydratase family protein, partial [Gammaproteobacteria bacterium]